MATLGRVNHAQGPPARDHAEKWRPGADPLDPPERQAAAARGLSSAERRVALLALLISHARARGAPAGLSDRGRPPPRMRRSSRSTLGRERAWVGPASSAPRPVRRSPARDRGGRGLVGTVLGTELLPELAARASEEGVRRFSAYVQEPNRPMLDLLRALGEYLPRAQERASGGTFCQWDRGC
jgi:hypothetical protein